MIILRWRSVAWGLHNKHNYILVISIYIWLDPNDFDHPNMYI